MIRLVRGQNDIEDVAEYWRPLEPLAPSVFQRHDFALEWWRLFGVDHELAVIYAENSCGRALLPLFIEQCEGRPRLRLIGSGLFDQLDLLLLGEPPMDELRTGLSRLGCDLSVDVTPAQSALARLLPDLFSSVQERYYSAMPLLQTAGWSIEDLRREHARGAYRHRRLLLRRGGQVCELTDPDAACSLLAQAFELKLAGLTEEQRRYLEPDDRHQRWMAALIRRHLGGLARLLSLTIRGEFAACVLYFHDPGGWSLYFTVYDKRFSQDSPGTVLLWDIIERAVGEGIPVVNFLTGEQWYKLRWHDRSVPLVSMEARGAVDMTTRPSKAAHKLAPV